MLLSNQCQYINLVKKNRNKAYSMHVEVYYSELLEDYYKRKIMIEATLTEISSNDDYKNCDILTLVLLIML